MWWFVSSKRLVRACKLLGSKIRSNLSLITNNSASIEGNTKELNSLRESLVRIQENLKVRETTPQGSPKVSAILKKKLSKLTIIAEINELVKRGLVTTKIYEIIVQDRAICKKTCFYKYLKLVRAEVRL